MLPTRSEIMSRFKDSQFYTKLDMSQGFWQCCLTDDASTLTTFNSPFGRYQYLRLPFGLNVAPEIFHRIVSQHFEDIPNLITVHDDMLIYAKTKEDHDETLEKVLKRAESLNLKFNKEKCKILIDSVTFMGEVISKEGIKPDDRKIQAIKELPSPNNLKDLRRILGMVNYLGNYIPNLSSIIESLRALTENDVKFEWTYIHENCLNQVKTILSSQPVLQHFDLNKPIKISCDASITGLGCCLLQNCDNDWKPVAYASRSLRDSEKRYAQIEKELLGILFGCTRFHQYIYGQNVLVETDHKPLEIIFKKRLDQLSPRLQRMSLKLQCYNLDVNYVPGKLLITADTLSRASIPDIDSNLSDKIETDIRVHVDNIIEQKAISSRIMNDVIRETKKDRVLCLLKSQIEQGWPNKKNQVDPLIGIYYLNNVMLFFLCP
ncbi:retrovirus-related Pol polyprotein from transposon 17.6 [Patella vulgata]|uniref:retrovirus-related Pol polyprotein from transposon 17.6 n=1 Tax=Patella vulgata TaxID=6465 RepID=UPI0024A8A48B|nr:retrovirus-related Pol polyprotein from transposon 17.6 [Patella vulgata]